MTDETSIEYIAPTSESDRDKYVNIETIAELGWQTHLAWESILGEHPRQGWEDLPETKRQEICVQVQWILDHPHAPISAQHDAWRAAKIATTGAHPNFVTFDALPFSQQMKARLWRNIIHAVVG